LQPDSVLIYFNMAHPVVGGLDPAKVALRRAIGLAVDVPREIRLVWKGQAIPAQSIVVPHTTGYDPNFKSEMGDHDPARARALLDLHGYTDRDGDGWREQPDGQPLLLEVATQPDQNSRQFDELWQRNMRSIGIRVKFITAQWPEQLKAARAGKLMVWQLGSSAAAPDGQGSLMRLNGPQAGGQNLARFSLPAFDRVYDRMSSLPDGPEREALFLEAKRLSVAYMPYKVRAHRILTDLARPAVVGYRRPLFWLDQWQHIDVVADPAASR
jgi:ABC-type transport system substrate-binding protein